MSPLCMRMKLYKQLKQATTKPLQSRSSPHGRLAPLQTPGVPEKKKLMEQMQAIKITDTSTKVRQPPSPLS